MRERGFMPFSAAGALIVLLVLGMISHAAWSRHQRSLSVADDISDSALLTAAAGIHGDIKAVLKYAVYQALWEVSKRADDYDDAGRKRAIEQLATEYFADRVAEVGTAYAGHDSRVELDVPESSAWPSINLKEVDGGYVLAQGRLPEGTKLRLRSRDDSLSLVLPLDNIEAFIDSRYFLIQERMGEFVGRRGDIATWWGVMEYLTAWSGAWLSGSVELDDSRSQAFFEVAWGIHEFNTFGSSDYWAIAQGLVDAVSGPANSITQLNEPMIVVTPISTADVDTLCGYIDLALTAIQDAAVHLEEAKRYVELLEDVGARPSENIRWLLGNVLVHVADARDKISNIQEHFDQLLEFMINFDSDDVVMDALYRSLTSRALAEDYPSLEEQVEIGTRGTLAKLSRLERLMTDALARPDVDAQASFLNELSVQAISSIEELFSEPTPQRWVTFMTYIGDPPQPTEEIAPVYIEDEANGTIGALKLVLEGAKDSLNEMKHLSQRYEPAPAELEFEIDEGLVLRLEGSLPEFTINREEFYELLPPQPIDSSPGLSVFHDFEIKSIIYRREDPAGWFGSPTATPIPLWFIGVTLWWGQWEVTLELESGSVEEVFDYDNPTIPRPYGVNYVHKPLAYRWEMPEEPFSIRVIIISLRPFLILDG